MNRRVDLARDQPRPSPTVIVLAVLALLALVMIAWLALNGDDSAPEPDPTAAPTTEPTDDPATDTPSPSPTETTTDDQPVDPIDELTFVDYAGVELPVHPTAGPTEVEPDGLATGFEDGELGAALAAVHLATRASGFGPLEVVGATINQQFVATDDRNRLLAEASRINAQLIDETGATDAPETEVVGFRIVQFVTGESATVEMLVLGQGTFGATRVGLVWVDNQWKAQPPPLGTWASEVTAPVQPDGFTIWKDF